jgi:metal-dependent amidase/aminoacylase/carboxypeptidase family protein
LPARRSPAPATSIANALRSIDDKRLKEWSAVDGTSGKRGNAVQTDMETAMITYYFQSSKEVMRETVIRHLDRMAKMDAQYNVCSRYAECWKR